MELEFPGWDGFLATSWPTLKRMQKSWSSAPIFVGGQEEEYVDAIEISGGTSVDRKGRHLSLGPL